MSRLLRWMFFGAGVVALGAVAYWAGRTAVLSPGDPLVTGERVTYRVVEQTIGRSLRFTALAEWDSAPLVRARSGGVVTSVEIAPGSKVESGDVLYTVDLRPVVIAAGETPAFRELKAGVRGPDVRQLGDLLRELGLLEREPMDVFDEPMTGAVRAWQESMGITADGIVQLGDVVFVPRLPVRVVPSDSLLVGAELADGETAVDQLAPEPKVVVPLTPDQRDLVPLSGTVLVRRAAGTWKAVIASAREAPGGQAGTLELLLEAPDGGPVCGSECPQWIDPVGITDFEAEIVVVPTTTGPVVPIAGLMTDPGGSRSVEFPDGSRVPVMVRVSTGGLAVVDGIEAGDIILLPFGSAGT